MLGDDSVDHRIRVASRGVGPNELPAPDIRTDSPPLQVSFSMWQAKEQKIPHTEARGESTPYDVH